VFGFPPDHGIYHRFVGPMFEAVHEAAGKAAHASLSSEVGMAGLSLTIALLGVILAHQFYMKKPELPGLLADRMKGVYRLLLNKYWVDELYQAIFVNFGKRVCVFLWGVDSGVVDGAVNRSSWLTVRLSFLSSWNDLKIVDGLVNAVADVIQGGSVRLRRLQTGIVQNYILAMSLGILGMAVIYLFVFR